MNYEIFCDGAVRSEGKHAAGAACCAFVVKKNNNVIYTAYRLLREDTTSNEAEYEALLLALTTAIAAKYPHPKIYTDSATVFNQVTGIWACKSPRLVPFLFTIKKMKQVYSFTLEQVPRSEVSIADSVCNEILDEFQGKRPSEDLDL